MPLTIAISIITSTKTVYEGKTVSVRIPAEDGYMEFRYQHAPLITSLGTGILSLRKADGRNLHFFINGGYAEIHENQLIILADTAENGEDIDYDRAVKAKNRSMKRILDQETGKWDIDRVKAAIERAESRINTVKRTGKGSLHKS